MSAHLVLSCPSLGVSSSSEESCSFCWNKCLVARSALCYWLVFAPKPVSWTELRKYVFFFTNLILENLGVFSVKVKFFPPKNSRIIINNIIILIRYNTKIKIGLLLIPM